MTQQGSLLPAFDEAARDPCANRSRGAPNSAAAFASIAPNLSDAEGRVLAALRRLENATIHDLCRELDVTPNQISGRLTSLRAKKLIRIVRTGTSPSGNACSMYAPTETPPAT